MTPPQTEPSTETSRRVHLIIPPLTQYACGNISALKTYVYYILANLKRSLIPVVFDDFLLDFEGFASYKASVSRKNYADVCIVIFQGNRGPSLDFLKILRQKNRQPFIILAGPFAGMFHNRYLNDRLAHVVILQDPEIALPRVLSTAREKYSGIPRIAFIKNNRVCETKGNNEHNLDDLPFVSPYFCKNTGKPVPVLTARGCGFSCAFCDKRLFWGTGISFRSIPNVLEEIELLYNRYGIRKIRFDDYDFLLKKQRAVTLCNAFIKKHLKIRWECTTRPDAVDGKLLRLMRLAGCRTIHFGLESGSPRILKTLGKPLDIKKAVKNIRLAKTHDIRVGIFLILGAPGETPGTIRQTKSVLRRLPLDELLVNPLILLPGSRLFKEFLKNKNISFDDYFETDKTLTYPCDWKKLSRHISPLARFFEVKPSLTT